MASVKYLVDLSEEEEQQLRKFISRGKVSARRAARARILLKANDGLSDEQVAVALEVGSATVGRIRQRFVEEGLEAALSEHPRPGKERLLDGKQEAYLVALACSKPPNGRRSWTMQLLAGRLVELKIVESISDETVRRTLKKGRSSPGSARNGASPA